MLMSDFKRLHGGVKWIGRDSASSFEVAMDVKINFSEVKSGAVSMWVFPLDLKLETFLELSHLIRFKVEYTLKLVFLWQICLISFRNECRSWNVCVRLFILERCFLAFQKTSEKIFDPRAPSTISWRALNLKINACVSLVTLRREFQAFSSYLPLVKNVNEWFRTPAWRC